MTKPKNDHAEDMYMDLDGLLEEAEDCPAVEQLFDKLEKEYAKQPLDERQLRRQEDWSAIAHQVVGGETVNPK